MMPDTVEIEDIATTKTAAAIDPDGDYLVGQSAEGSTFRALVEEVVRGVLAQIVSELEIGDDVNIDGKVGIGTTSPSVKLHLNELSSDVSFRVQRADQSSGGYTLTHSSSVSTYSDLLSLATSGADGTLLLFGSGSYVMNLVMLDGTITSNHIVARVDNTYDVGSGSYRFDDVYATNGTIQTSDRRMKSDIADSDLGLEFIETLRPVSFRRDGGGKRTHYGLIAQEVETALAGRDFAGLIYDKTSDRYGLRYDELVGPLIKAVQELSQRVQELEQGA